MDFRTTKIKALDNKLPLDVRRAYVVLSIEAAWGDICLEKAILYFGKKYDLWGEHLNPTQIYQMVEELDARRGKSILLQKQYELYSNWKNKKGLTLTTVNGMPAKEFFDKKIGEIWAGMVA